MQVLCALQHPLEKPDEGKGTWHGDAKGCRTDLQHSSSFAVGTRF